MSNIESVEKKRSEIRKILKAANSHYVSVSFFKKDGSARVMTCNPKEIIGHIKEEISESAKKAVETRKLNHPHLLNVWDVHANSAKSINLDTVYEIKAGGKIYTYETERKNIA